MKKKNYVKFFHHMFSSKQGILCRKWQKSSIFIHHINMFFLVIFFSDGILDSCFEMK